MHVQVWIPLWLIHVCTGLNSIVNNPHNVQVRIPLWLLLGPTCCCLSRMSAMQQSWSARPKWWFVSWRFPLPPPWQHWDLPRLMEVSSSLLSPTSHICLKHTFLFLVAVVTGFLTHWFPWPSFVFCELITVELTNGSKTLGSEWRGWFDILLAGYVKEEMMF